MHVSQSLLLIFPLLASAIDVSFFVAPSNALPNPRAALPPDTHATLTSLKRDVHIAPITILNSFIFHNITLGSYLVEFNSRSHAFAPVRLDVGILDDGKPDNDGDVVLKAWETFRGNDWDNKGEGLQLTNRGFEAKCVGHKNYFTERQKFSVLSILKNPMILLGLFSMLIFVGMPKLMDNMDPELKAEWEEHQKNNPMNAVMGGGQQQNPLGDFDLASYLSGAKTSNGGKKKK